MICVHNLLLSDKMKARQKYNNYINLTQNTDQCFCGNGKTGSRIDEENCSHFCMENSGNHFTWLCGGVNSMSLYLTRVRT